MIKSAWKYKEEDRNILPGIQRRTYILQNPDPWYHSGDSTLDVMTDVKMEVQSNNLRGKGWISNRLESTVAEYFILSACVSCGQPKDLNACAN